ncbi:potassium channel subfamily K member 10-like isoform X2 [Clavelina lepadiformis]|uniref:Potassium channel domain-containing protein n=1 Tax=Clavelina lepadiformis TaxID=159417 RepID=A0ABP0GU44_CLALP
MNYKTLFTLCIAYFVYMLFGALVFQALEKNTNNQRCQEAIAFKQELMNRSKPRDFFKEMDDIISNLSSFAEDGINMKGNVTCSTTWNFQSAFFFSGTIITTIGYGNIVPSNETSRAFCIIYALVGIPLFAIMFSGLGEVISNFLSKLSSHVDKLDTKPWIKNFLIYFIFGLFGFTLFCCIPAAIFSIVEKWPYTVSLYFTVITLTTIGFGDYVIGENPDIDYIPLYRIMVYLWMLFGFAFMATFVQFTSERLRQRAKSRKDRRRQKKVHQIKTETTPEDSSNLTEQEGSNH